MQADQFPQGWDKNSSQGHVSVSSSGYNSLFKQVSFFLLRPKQKMDKQCKITELDGQNMFCNRTRGQLFSTLDKSLER